MLLAISSRIVGFTTGAAITSKYIQYNIRNSYAHTLSYKASSETLWNIFC